MCREKDDLLRFGIEIRVKLRGFGGRDKSAILIPRRKNSQSNESGEKKTIEGSARTKVSGSSGTVPNENTLPRALGILLWLLFLIN
jgi:hypothetical protein